MKISINSIIILIFFQLFFGTSAVAQQILWRANCHLSSDDFKGKKPRKSKWVAVTATQLHYTLNKNSKDSTSVKVDCIFDMKQSWKKYKTLNHYILQHEQTHFDIAELYARKLRQALKKYIVSKDKLINPDWKLQYILFINNHGSRHYQKKYDGQTKHSNRRTAQREWNAKIADELNALREYEVK